MDNIEANQPLDDVRGANFTANGRTPDHVVNVHAKGPSCVLFTTLQPSKQ